ncbi:hypothetical protein V1520DRAFT_337228 [Lipomyces starkeyi]|uniref:SUZ domain-containing protein n=1 Tax=Lipomyces starkeyi NRRL Y-11557 TaxID=675824 RepID=A0A1E3QI60_LIPST|nr:hypothetical protein LIPSTDRAFT_67644 [Lipomyces starkeyi NRRL Y-11557]
MKSTTPNGGIRIMRRETPINDASSDTKSEASSVTNESGAGNSKDGSGNARIATTLEERTAAYEEARKRIFKDFPESSVSGSDDEKDREDEDGKGSGAANAQSGNDRKTSNNYAADDEDFPRRSQYVPLGSGYYQVYDRNSYTPPHAYNGGVTGVPTSGPATTNSAPNNMTGYGNDHAYNHYGRAYVANVPNAQTGYNVPRPQIPQQQYAAYTQQPQQQAYQQGTGSPYQHYGQNGYQSQPDFYGGLDAQNGQRRNYGQYQQPVQQQPYGAQRPPYLAPVSSAQQATYGAPSYPQYPHQQLQAQYTAAQQQFYIPPDQLQQSAAYKYQQQQLLPRFGANSNTYSAPPPQSAVSLNATQQALYQQMQNLNIRPSANVHQSNSNASLSSMSSNGSHHGFNKYPHNQMPFQQKFYSPKQQYVPYGQQSSQHPYQPPQQTPLRPQSQPASVPCVAKPMASQATQSSESKTDADGSGANMDDSGHQAKAEADLDSASADSVETNVDGKLPKNAAPLSAPP